MLASYMLIFYKPTCLLRIGIVMDLAYRNYVILNSILEFKMIVISARQYNCMIRPPTHVRPTILIYYLPICNTLLDINI